MTRWLIPAAALLLASCSSEMDELKQFVKDSEKSLPRKIDALPAVKPFEPFTYEGFDLPDPFKPRKITSKEGGGGGIAPDLNRRTPRSAASRISRAVTSGGRHSAELRPVARLTIAVSISPSSAAASAQAV